MQNPLPEGLGYTKTLAILPFDHRTGLYRELSWTEPLSDEQVTQMGEYRTMIYEGLKQSLGLGIPKEEIGVLTDDVFGKQVLLDSVREGFVTIQTTEKSGTSFFDFEHGENFGATIEEVHPTFAKALVRYNPDGNSDDNQRSLQNLKKLSDLCHTNGYKLLIEPLVPGTDEQLASVGTDKHRYDTEIRPQLTARMITEMQNAGIEADIWKIEGFENPIAYKLIVQTARADGRNGVGVITLGRNETDEIVETWLRSGAGVDGVIGFAVGRTVFLDPIIKFRSGEFTREQTINSIAEKFFHFYKIFTESKI